MNLMPILFCYISQVIGQWKLDTFTSKMWRKEQQGSALRHQSTFNIKKHLPLVLKKIVPVLFYVFQINLNKAVDILCKLSEWIRNIQMIECFNTIKTWMRILHG